MLVKVTADHIARGERRRSVACPVALALTDLGLRDVCVGYESFSYRTGFTTGFTTKIDIQFSKAARERIEEYDCGGTMTPFSFRAPIDGSTSKQSK